VLDIDLMVVPSEVDQTGRVLAVCVAPQAKPLVVRTIAPGLFTDEDLHHLVPAGGARGQGDGGGGRPG
jgi:hypothetical protein